MHPQIIEYLSEESISVTLFAPDDEALKDIGHHHQHADDAGLHDGFVSQHPFDLVSSDVSLSQSHVGVADDSQEDRRRKIIRHIVTAILRYHIAPIALDKRELLDTQTIPTTLNQSRHYGVPFRIRNRPDLRLIPPPPCEQAKLNFFATTRGPVLKAKNGFIHLVSPLPALCSIRRARLLTATRCSSPRLCFHLSLPSTNSSSSR